MNFRRCVQSFLLALLASTSQPEIDGVCSLTSGRSRLGLQRHEDFFALHAAALGHAIARPGFNNIFMVRSCISFPTLSLSTAMRTLFGQRPVHNLSVMPPFSSSRSSDAADKSPNPHRAPTDDSRSKKKRLTITLELCFSYALTHDNISVSSRPSFSV